MKNKSNLDIFISRLEKIGIKIMLANNYPWIYIYTINDKYVTEKFQAEHGFTVAFQPIRPNSNNDVRFTDIGEIFKLIRKYLDE